MDLSPHQQQAVEVILTMLQEGRRNVLAEIVSGTGKTVVALTLVEQIHKENKGVILLTKSKQLRDSLQATLPIFSRPNIKGKSEDKDVRVGDVNDAFSFLVSSDYDADIYITLDFTLADKIASNLRRLFDERNDRHEYSVISIVSAASEGDRELYGDPVFSYKLEDAIRDGNTTAFTFYSCEDISKQRLKASLNIQNSLKPFFEEVGKRSIIKAVILCETVEKAAALQEILRTTLTKNIFSIHSEISQEKIQLALDSFRNSKESTFAVVVDIWSSNIDFPWLTDIVFVRKIKSLRVFRKVLQLAIRLHEGKDVTRVWDFGGNRRFYESNKELGNVVQPLTVKSNTKVGDDLDNGLNASDIDQGIENTDASDSEDNKYQEKQLTQKRIIPTGDNASTEDLLGRGRLIHVLKGLIEYSSNDRNFRPFVIGLLGRWGSGKSTVINLLKDEFADADRVYFLPFNAWQNEHCKNMAAALANSLIDDIYQSRNIFSRAFLIIKYRLFNKRDALANFLLLTALLIPLVLVMDITEIKKLAAINPISKLSDNQFWYIVSAMLGVGAIVRNYFNHPFTSQIRSLLKKPDYSEHLGISQKIKDEIEALLNASGVCVINERLNKQFIVVIDDLDRCSDEKIFEVLEAIRLIIDLPNVVVFLAVDQTILVSAVANRYRNQNKRLEWSEALSLGRNFLGKIVQIAIELDAPGPQHMTKFVAERLYKETENINHVTQHIQEGAELVKEEEDASAEIGELLDQPPTDNLFEHGLIFEEDELDDIEMSDDYLRSSQAESQIFSKCVGAFEINNPRTLVRLHNTITLIKGLYPEIAHNPENLSIYIYLAFLHETYAASDKSMQEKLKLVFNEEESEGQGFLIKRLRLLGNELKVFGEQEKIRITLNRVRKLSLPVTSGVTAEQDAGY